MCIFCKIINGEIPSQKIYEDDDVLAILDISQANIGHTLVLPKKHFSNILEIEDYDYLKVMDKVKDIALAIKKAFNAEGINVLNNCGEAAGQTVNHFHVHVIPRNINDGIKFEFVNNQDKFNLDEIRQKIIKNL